MVDLSTLDPRQHDLSWLAPLDPRVWAEVASAAGIDLWDVLAYALILWATTGLLFLHLLVVIFGLARTGLARVFGRGKPREVRVDEGGPRPTLAFLVPVYNEAVTVATTIESILDQSVPPDEVVVVDDGSTDDTPSVLAPFAARGVTILRLPRNSGKTRALEEGLRVIESDLVAITDADSLVDPHYVKEMLPAFRDPKVAAVGGSVESIPHTWVTAARQIEYMVTVNVDRAAQSDMGTIIVLPGVSTTYRRRVLEELGFEYDTIAEDFDLTFRMQKAGLEARMNLRAKVYTSDPPTLVTYWRQVLRWYTDFWICVKKHRDIFGRRLFGAVEVPLLVMNIVAVSALYLVLPPLLLLTDPEKLLVFLAVGTIFDVGLIVLAHGTYRRADVWLSILSRYPTRVLGRVAFLLAMMRVLVNRPGLAWQKLERRRNDAYLAAIRLPHRAR